MFIRSDRGVREVRNTSLTDDRFDRWPRLWTNARPPTAGQLFYVVQVPPLSAAEVSDLWAGFEKAPDKCLARLKALAPGIVTPNPEVEKVIDMPGGMGRQYAADYGARKGILRIGLTKSRCVMWLVVGEKQPDENAPDVKAFFDSFRIE